MSLRISAFCGALLMCVGVDAATLVAPLQLEDEGSFFVNGQVVTTKYPGASLVSGPAEPGRITVNQMYVHYRIPVGMKAVPIVMVHGSNHTGMIYETTPDGREGWGTYFVRRGFPVYVVDHAGRGRSGFNPTIVNQVRDAPAFRASSRSSTKRSSRSSSKDSNRDSSADVLPTLFVGTHERAWQNFRFGPSYGVPFPNVQFPVETVDQYFAQLVPNTETTLANGAVNTVDALAALLDKIGSAVVIVHSQSGVYGLDLVRERGQLVRGLISIEGGCEGVTPPVAGANFTSVPFVSFGAITASAQRTP